MKLLTKLKEKTCVWERWKHQTYGIDLIYHYSPTLILSFVIEWAIVCLEGKSMNLAPLQWAVSEFNSFMQDNSSSNDSSMNAFRFQRFNRFSWMISYRHSLRHRHRAREYVESPILKAPQDKPSFQSIFSIFLHLKALSEEILISKLCACFSSLWFVQFISSRIVFMLDCNQRRWNLSHISREICVLRNNSKVSADAHLERSKWVREKEWDND